ncbi:MAG: SCP2 sterol-binding domain-containing protein [Promethearchaeota archaeon]
MKEERNVKPLRLKDSGMAAIFAGMATLYNPKAIPELEAVMQFNLENENYYLLFNENTCKAYSGSHSNPTTTIITQADIWTKISMGEIDGQKAFMEGLFKVKGDINLLLNLEKMFKRGDVPDRSSRTIKKYEKIPDHRGPLKVPGSFWLSIAFIPWIILWIWGSISPGLYPQIVAAGVALTITLYHLKTNRPTLWETGTCIYLIFAAFLYAIRWNFFIEYSSVIDNIFISGLWLGSLVKEFSLTAEYIRYDFPRQIWGTRAFKETNNILTLIWGVFFLFQALLKYYIIIYSQFFIILTIIAYILLIPMFTFTVWFQMWYPPKIIKK